MGSLRTSSANERTTAELREWVQAHLGLEPERAGELLQRIEDVLSRQRQLVEESKHDAIRAMSEGFAAKMERLQHQLSEKDVTVSNIARYFEEAAAVDEELNEQGYIVPGVGDVGDRMYGTK